MEYEWRDYSGEALGGLKGEEKNNIYLYMFLIDWLFKLFRIFTGIFVVTYSGLMF